MKNKPAKNGIERNRKSLVKSFFTSSIPVPVSSPISDLSTKSELPSRSPSRMSFHEPTPPDPSRRPRTLRRSKRLSDGGLQDANMLFKKTQDIAGMLHSIDEGDSSDSSDDSWPPEDGNLDSDPFLAAFASPFPSVIEPIPHHVLSIDLETDECPPNFPVCHNNEPLPLVILPPPNPVRPLPAHHGHSRSALQHLKWVWSLRYEEWMQYHLQLERIAQASAYGGIVDVAIPEPPSSRSRSTSPTKPAVRSAEKGRVEMNPNIFPRTGDLSSLHDPEAAMIDRAFCHYPLYTIQKVLFVHGMDTRASRSSRWDHSDDSSENCASLFEDPLPQSPPRPCVAISSGDLDETPIEDWDSANTSFYMSAEEMKNSKLIPLTEFCRERRAREDSWQGRWEVLTELVNSQLEDELISMEQHSGERFKSTTVTTSVGLPVVVRPLEHVPSTEPKIDVQRPKSPAKFFLGDLENEIDWDDDDDDETYGLIMANPMFTRQKDGPREETFAIHTSEKGDIKVGIMSSATMVCV